MARRGGLGQPTFPVCGSLTRLHGVGAPGGDCGACAFNQFGSSQMLKDDGEIVSGKGKRCAERTWVFALECIDLSYQRVCAHADTD